MPKNPNNHVKPTKEELEKQTQDAIEEAEKLKDKPPEGTPEEEEAAKAEAEKEQNEEGKQEKEEESKVPPVEEEGQEKQSKEDQAEPSEKDKEALKEKLDAEKKKSSASARENQKIYAKNRVINKALSDAEEVPEPTEEELAAEFGDWDVMSDVERTLAKETVISRNWRKVISEAKEQATKIEQWNESVETFVDDPKTLIDNPDLEGKVDEFRTFAIDEANNSVPFNILVSAFLHNHSVAKLNNKGRMFEKGSGGPNDKPQPKDGSITLEEARKLRESNYGKYKEYLIAGKIKSDL